ncbi:Presequence protease, mitochondrial [Strongyloides ratti]|uniref:Vacuolar protein sorting-associated protein 16 homolog n=1 Tax=Strongyloides ratti TaxID=34506 RepID=A0A090LIK6_STRRB|nr:Presequence protease, mitochondrial [Strongyloides ratti]CEF67320.1 Presequence protease, mitochondrial [Strongyloides ratti]
MYLSSNSIWINAGGALFDKTILYRNLKTGIEKCSMFKACPYGGPIAIYCIEKVNNSFISYIEIKGNNNKIYGKINVRNVLGIEWTQCHKLIVIFKDGKFSIYSPRGKEIVDQICFDISVKQLGVLSYHIFYGPVNTGIAILTEGQQFFAVNNVLEASVWKHRVFIDNYENIEFWNVVCHASLPTTIFGYLKDDNCFFVAAQGSNSFKKKFDWSIENGAYITGETNWNNTIVGLLHDTLVIQLVSNDLSTATHIIEVKQMPLIKKIFWCGFGAPCLLDSDKVLHIYTSKGDDSTIIFDSPVVVSSEEDGLRVYSEECAYFICPVAKSAENIFSVESHHPASTLYVLSKKEEDQYTTSFELLTTIMSSLEDAVRECLLAALNISDTKLIVKLIKAANIGRMWESKIDSDYFAATLKTIKILSSLRADFIGMPLSFRQFQKVEIRGVIDRLIDLGHWPLAVKICEFMELPLEEGVHRVFAHWAIDFIERCMHEIRSNNRKLTNEEMANLIFTKAERFPDISYAEIAKEIYDRSSKDDNEMIKLADILLDKEKDVSLKVKMYLQSKQWNKAIYLADKSQRPDLYYIVINALKSMPYSKVFVMTAKCQNIHAYLKEITEHDSPDDLISIYKTNDEFVQLALHYISYNTKNTNNPFVENTKLENLKAALESFKNLDEKDTSNYLNEYINIFDTIKSYSNNEYSSNLSVKELFKLAVKEKNNKLAEEIGKKFSITEKEGWTWKLEAYSENCMWEHVKTMASHPKSPIGYYPYLEKCYNKDPDRQDLQFYISRLSTSKELIKGYILLGRYDDALEQAKARKDVDSLNYMRRKFRNDSSFQEKLRQAFGMTRQFWNVSSQIKFRGTVPVSIYNSKRSNLNVAVADVPGPMVHGYLSFPTEANCDAGLPHTLEHLVFMGSKEYPYKGILDIIANRCLASGTNAWTAQDHTCYTLSTAGSNGFFKILPVYIDHVLRPTLTNNQYLTEVHHINGSGEDAGVVYSEMQDYESDMDDIVDRELRASLFGKGHPFSVNTGGSLKAIREECSYKSVTDFHKKFYNLKNMIIVVCGMVDHKDLLEVIEKCEEKYICSHSPEFFIRPFSNAKIQDIKENRVSVVNCPCEDDSKGIVEIAFLGPAVDSYYEVEAMDTLFNYFHDTAISPLEKDFVQLKDPYASSCHFMMDEYTRNVIRLKFSDVPVNKIMNVHERFFDKTVEEHKNPNVFDMDRMKSIISKQIEKLYMTLEKNAGKEVLHNVIAYQLYGNRESNKDIEERFNDQIHKEKLLNEPAEFWADLVSRYFNKNSSVCVIGKPDAKLVDECADKEKNRIMKQKEKLGTDGLKKCALELENAIASNSNNKPSKDLLNEFIVRDLENFFSFNINTVSNFENKKQSPFAKTFPIPTFIHNNPSKFVEAVVLIDTKGMPLNLRKYLVLLSDIIFSSPAMIDGKEISFEDVSKAMENDLIDWTLTTGVKGIYERYLALKLKVSAKDYRNIAKWVNILLKNIIFEKNRIEITALKLANQAHEYKRDGYSMVMNLSNSMIYNNDANEFLFSVVPLEKFHKEIAKKIKKESSQITDDLNSLLDFLLKSTINLHILANEHLIEEFGEFNKKDWEFLVGCKNNELISQPEDELNKDGFNKQTVLGVGGTESSFVIQKIYFSQDFTGPDIAEILLFSQYLSQLEGPLWNKIRGKGLAYGASIYPYPDKHTITLSLYRCAQAVQAIEETKKLIYSIIESQEIVESEFEAAKRSLVYEMMEGEKSIKDASIENLLSTLKNVPTDYKRKLCAKIWNLKADECFKKASPYIKELFDETKISRAIIVNPSKIKKITEAYPQAQVKKIEDLYQ